jgi:hypothetical protein
MQGLWLSPEGAAQSHATFLSRPFRAEENLQVPGDCVQGLKALLKVMGRGGEVKDEFLPIPAARTRLPFDQGVRESRADEMRGYLPQTSTSM